MVKNIWSELDLEVIKNVIQNILIRQLNELNQKKIGLITKIIF